MAESKVAVRNALYNTVGGSSQIQSEPKSITEISNKLDSRFRIHYEGQTTNQKIYQGMALLVSLILVSCFRINYPCQSE